jgi:membrane-associated protease RseP (regulator of RpoE activity)
MKVPFPRRRPVRPFALVACGLLLVPLGAADTAAGGPPPPPAPAPPMVSPAPRPFLGVTIDDAAPVDPAHGLLVTTVVPGSTAAQLGINPGDGLLTFNGTPLHARSDLSTALSAAHVGDTVTIVVARHGAPGGQPSAVTGALLERPQVRTLSRDITAVQVRVNDLAQQMLRLQDKRPVTLQEVLAEVKEVEENLPRAAAAFKEQYPKGRFDIRITVDVTSDATASKPLEIGTQPNADLPLPGPDTAVPPAQAAPVRP